jgi:hypothetical protein
MRAGYVMHRYLHRLLAGEAPGFSYPTDGAEMGKLMVAEGLGVTVLPSFSVIGDQLEVRDVITWRPLAGDQTRVRLVIQRLRSGSPPQAARDLHRIFVQQAQLAAVRLARLAGAAAPSGDVPSGDVLSGDVLSGDVLSGDVPSGDVPSGDVPSGDVPSGDLTPGSAPDGGGPDTGGRTASQSAVRSAQ